MKSKSTEGKAKGKSGTTFFVCSCTNSFQDRKYGAGRRVHNISQKHDKAYCTACGNAKEYR